MVLENLTTAFVLGLLTPLTAVCVLPLYPGFLAFLSNALKGSQDKKLLILFGLIVGLGVITFMFLLGLIFTTFLQVSLTQIVGIVSPIAFGILGIISILLIFDVDFARFFPHIERPQSKNPLVNAFVFGFFFGAIVLPCNPGFIAALFVQAVSTTAYATNILTFLFFGIGMAFPLILFSGISATASKQIIGFLTRYKSWINRITGILMLGISIYYLFFVFRIIG